MYMLCKTTYLSATVQNLLVWTLVVTVEFDTYPPRRVTRYIGKWSKDSRDGPGVLVTSEGTVKEGYFKDSEVKVRTYVYVRT